MFFHFFFSFHVHIRFVFVFPKKKSCPTRLNRVKYIIADQLAVEAKQEDESEYEGGGGTLVTGEGGEGEEATAAGGAEEAKGKD